jgi:hypothetical protein
MIDSATRLIKRNTLIELYGTVFHVYKRFPIAIFPF